MESGSDPNRLAKYLKEHNVEVLDKYKEYFPTLYPPKRAKNPIVRSRHGIILVNEMAFPKSVYERKVLGLGIQLVDNWCLCKWCQLYSQDNPNRSHWAGELITHIRTIQSWDIKGKVDKRKTLERLLVEYCDYGKTEKISSIIRSKFNDEHIMDENQRASVATEFVGNLSKTMDVLSDASIDAGAHVRETFNPPAP